MEEKIIFIVLTKGEFCDDRCPCFSDGDSCSLFQVSLNRNENKEIIRCGSCLVHSEIEY